jgi:tetratricopeptide (TPR) repeat protein
MTTPSLDTLLKEGDLDTARRLAEAALKSSPGDRKALLTLAKLATFDGDFTKAGLLAARATLDGGDDVDSLLVKAAVSAQTKDDIDDAVKMYEQAIAMAKPPRSEAHFGLGMVLASAGRFTAARAPLEKAVALDPKIGQFHFHLARVLLADEKLAEGLPHLEKSIELNPLYPPVYEACTFVLQEFGEVAAAEKLLREGLKLMPKHPFLLGLLSNVLVARGNVPEAMKISQALAAEYPNEPEAIGNYARLMMATGHQDAALELVQKLENEGKATPQTRALEGQLLESKNPPDIDGAIAAYAAAAKQDHRDWSSLNNLGHLLMRREGDEAENLGAASEALEAAAMRAPHRLEPLLNLALVYARLDRADEAIDVAQEVVTRANAAQADLKKQAQKLISTLK